jgi:hypothetical protein
VSDPRGGYGDERAVASVLRRLDRRCWNVRDALGDVRWLVLGLFSGFWRNGSICRRDALVLITLFEITGILSASVFNMERCAVGPRPQGLLERPGEDRVFVFVFVWGGPQKAWDSRGGGKTDYV